jgi:uncharacterized protein with GYD domain
MATFIVLGTFTDQGIRKIKGLAELRRSAEQWVASKGGRAISNYTTLGPYDFVFTYDVASDDLALEGSFTFGSMGDVRLLTLRAFPYEEAETIAQRLP